jgi:hypothetical protein
MERRQWSGGKINPSLDHSTAFTIPNSPFAIFL